CVLCVLRGEFFFSSPCLCATVVPPSLSTESHAVNSTLFSVSAAKTARKALHAKWNGCRSTAKPGSRRRAPRGLTSRRARRVAPELDVRWFEREGARVRIGERRSSHEEPLEEVDRRGQIDIALETRIRGGEALGLRFAEEEPAEDA